MSNIYEPPKSTVLRIEDEISREPSLLLIILVVMFTLLASALAFLRQLVVSGMLTNGVGGALAPPLVGFCVVGFFQIGKRFRNKRSRYRIFLWSQIYFLISLFFSLIGEFASHT